MPLRFFLSLNCKATQTLVALAVCLLTPSVVGASCGDYVMVAGVRDHAGRAVARTEALVALAPGHSPASPKHGTPCSGPFCSQGQSVPLIIPPAPSTVEVEEWGCVVAFVSIGGVNALASLH